MHTVTFNSVCWPDETRVKIEFSVWDVSGSPEFKDMRKSCYAGADGVILMCKATHGNESLDESMREWSAEIKDALGENTTTLVCANRCELGVCYDDLNRAMGNNRLCEWYCTVDTKNDVRREKPFVMLAEQLTDYACQEFVN